MMCVSAPVNMQLTPDSTCIMKVLSLVLVGKANRLGSWLSRCKSETDWKKLFSEEEAEEVEVQQEPSTIVAPRSAEASLIFGL